MFSSCIVCHLADLVDLGIDGCLDHICSVGATDVTLIVTSGPAAYLRSTDVKPRVFREEGGWFYPPDPGSYAGIGAEPVVSDWGGGQDYLAGVIVACRERDLHVRLRVSALGVGRCGRANPATLASNVFGDEATYTLCPANSDVRAMLVATVNDLAKRYAPDSIELSELRYHSGTISDVPLEIGFDPGSSLLSLLNICFSDSSRQWAAGNGVDPEAAAQCVYDLVTRSLSEGCPIDKTWAELLRGDQSLRDYITNQVQVLDTLLDEVSQSVDVPVRFVLAPEVVGAVTPSQGTLSRAGSVTVEMSADHEGELGSILDQTVPQDASCEMSFDVADVTAGGEQHLVSIVKEASETRADGIALSHLGVIPTPRFKTIRQAIRFAVRESD